MGDSSLHSLGVQYASWTAREIALVTGLQRVDAQTASTLWTLEYDEEAEAGGGVELGRELIIDRQRIIIVVVQMEPLAVGQ